MIDRNVAILAAGTLMGIAACDNRAAAPAVAPETDPAAETEIETEPERQPEPAREPVMGREDPQPERMADDPDEDVLQVADVTRDPDAYVDQRVTLQGEVGPIYGTRAFRLNDGAPRQGTADALIVLGGRTVRWLIDDGWADDAVRAEGTVRRASTRELQRELRRQFEPEVEEAVQDESIVVVAEDVLRLTSDEPQR